MTNSKKNNNYNNYLFILFNTADRFYMLCFQQSLYKQLKTLNYLV